MARCQCSVLSKYKRRSINETSWRNWFFFWKIAIGFFNMPTNSGMVQEVMPTTTDGSVKLANPA
jgi:hypothetical protein